MSTNNIFRCLTVGLSLSALAMTGGCATTDTVSPRLPELQDQINMAKDAGAETYAPDPLKMAERKLGEAKSAVIVEDMATGNRLVDEAMLDADYARVLAPTEKAKQEGEKLREEIQTVRTEINQLTGIGN